jgi:hypothetical protein
MRIRGPNKSVSVGLASQVKMNPVNNAPANQCADTHSGVPDPTTAGPPWIQIGTEGGFTPAPVVIPQQPIGYNLHPCYFNFGVVNQHSLFLMAAERAVCLSRYEKKLIGEALRRAGGNRVGRLPARSRTQRAPPRSGGKLKVRDTTSDASVDLFAKCRIFRHFHGTSAP